jgi:hypothetical protein
MALARLRQRIEELTGRRLANASDSGQRSGLTLFGLLVRSKLAQIIKELGRRFDASNQQPIASASAGDV